MLTAEPETAQILSQLRGEDLMDLGTEAQAQGRALSIRAVKNRLAGVAADLEMLGLASEAQVACHLHEALGEHVDWLMGALEERGKRRRGELEPS